MATTKVITTSYRRVIVMVRPLDETVAPVTARLPVVVRRLTVEDLRSYRAFRPDADLEAICTRLARGDDCFASWHEGRIVHALWGATGRVSAPYLGRDVIAEPGGVYIHDSYVLPAYRGLGLAEAASAHMMRWYRRRGYRRLAHVVGVENTAALRLARKREYLPVGRFSCLRLGRWQRDWYTAWGEQPLRIVAPGRASPTPR